MTAALSRVDPGLFEYCTVRQLEILEAIVKHKGMRPASRALGICYTHVSDAVRAVEKKAAVHGFSPQHDLTRKVAPGFTAKGHSTLYRKGQVEPVLQWVKTSADTEQREAIVREAIKALSDDVKGMAPLVGKPDRTNADLLCVYPLGDPHIGMYAWAKEAGDDFDLPTAKRITLGAVDRLVQAAPDAETAIILPLGDVFHMDDQTNQTPAHKHQLDADGRFVKVLEVGIQTFRHTILRALEKHARVVVRFVPGNHDPHAIWSLAFTISAYFEAEPRVTVDLSPAKHWFYRFGQVLIGATHGDTTKHADLLGIMAVDCREDWGQTLFRYFYTGHIHNSTVTELPGLTCESFRTLAAKDAFSAGRKYRAGRDMRLIVHHKDYGEVERHRCDIAMVGA